MGRKTYLIVLSVICMVTGTANAQFKVCGYIFSKENLVADLNKVDLNQLTHLNIAFVNPSPAGDFKEIPALDTVVKMAHQHNVKVLMSCGGGSSHAYYAKLLADDQRQLLVTNFIAFLDKYNLDGIDVDLEGDDIDANYEAFVVALHKQLSKRKKILSAAVAWWTRDRFTDRALRQFDFINIMAYDKTGPLRPADPGQHAPLSYAVEHLNYWKNERGLAKEKLNLGLPFYGYGFSEVSGKEPSIKSMGWKDLVAQYPDYMELDEIKLAKNGGHFYYNGKNTIKIKTELALKEAGGVMIWQLLQDTADANSLLKLITEGSSKK